MYRTAAKVSSDAEQKAFSRDLAGHIARTNGYPTEAFHGRRRGRAVVTAAQAQEEGKIPFCIPFLSDETSASIRTCLRKAGLQDLVRVIEIPPTNLKGQLVRNRLYDRTSTTPSCVVCPLGSAGLTVAKLMTDSTVDTKQLL